MNNNASNPSSASSLEDHKSKSKTPSDNRSRWSPASLYAYFVSRSPRIIGWNDDVFRDLVEKSNYSSGLFSRNDFSEGKQRIEEFRSGLFQIFVDALMKNFDTLVLWSSQGEANPSPDKLQYKTSSSAVESPLDERAHSQLQEVKETHLYNLALHMIKYHRDEYLVGATFANIRRFDRTLSPKNQQQLLLNPRERITHVNAPLTDIPSFIGMEESLGSIHLNQLASWFVPSKTMIHAIRPTVLWTVAPRSKKLYKYQPSGGLLYDPLVQAVTDLIPMSQSILDPVLKNRVLSVLTDPQWRSWVKGSTGGYVSKLQQDFKYDWNP